MFVQYLDRIFGIVRTGYCFERLYKRKYHGFADHVYPTLFERFQLCAYHGLYMRMRSYVRYSGHVFQHDTAKSDGRA